MPKLAYDRKQYYADVYQTYPKISEVRRLSDYCKKTSKPVVKKKIKKINIFQQIVSITFLLLLQFLFYL